MSKYGPVPCQKIAIFDQKWLLWEFSLFKHIEWSSCSPALGNNHDNQKNHPSSDYIKLLLCGNFISCVTIKHISMAGRHPQVMVSSWMIFFQSKWDHIVYHSNNSLNRNTRTYFDPNASILARFQVKYRFRKHFFFSHENFYHWRGRWRKSWIIEYYPGSWLSPWGQLFSKSKGFCRTFTSVLCT